MQFPAEVIESAFRDYLQNEVDESGRVWFPKPAQIKTRCEEVLEGFNQRKAEGKTLSQIEQWKRESEGQETYGMADVVKMIREGKR